MKEKRTILFRIASVVILVVIAAVMLVIGRGHTVYLDNKALEYNGQTYQPLYKVVAYVNGEEAAKLYDGDRGMATCIGQKFKVTLEVTPKKGGTEEVYHVTLYLPYKMDGIAINLSGYLAGLPEESYLSEFVIKQVETEEESEEETIDEFGIGGDI